MDLATPSFPQPVLVVLVGASGSGKSTWAASRFASGEVVSSDALRAATGTGESDVAASADAFDVLRRIVEARVRRRLSCVVDTLGTDAGLRADLVGMARRHGMAVHAVVLDTPGAMCRARNRERASKRVPVAVLDAQLRTVASVVDDLAGEGFDAVHLVRPDPSVATAAAVTQTARPGAREPAPAVGGGGRRLRFGLHLSTFASTPDRLGPDLSEIARVAEEVGFDSLWAMDTSGRSPSSAGTGTTCPRAPRCSRISRRPRAASRSARSCRA